MASLVATTPEWFQIVSTIPFAFLWCCVLCVIAVQVRIYLCHRRDLDFKRELIDQGFAIEEIERLIAAKKSS